MNQLGMVTLLGAATLWRSAFGCSAGGVDRADASATMDASVQSDAQIADAAPTGDAAQGDAASAAGDARLLALSVVGRDLSPSFSEDTFEYTAEVPLVAHSILLTLSPVDSDATVRIDGTETPWDDPIAVEVTIGEQVVEIQVDVPEGDTRTYELTITRGEPTVITSAPPEFWGGFGQAVAMTNDILVVGSPGDRTVELAAGSATVFTRQDDDSWGFTTLLTSSPTFVESFALFGRSVAISGDTIVIGAPGEHSGANMSGLDDAGAAYVFVLSEGEWILQDRLLGNDPEASGGFGISVAIEGNTLVIGSPYQNCIIDVVEQGNCGAAFVYTRSSGVWTLRARLESSPTQQGAEFGHAVAIDGARIAIGAYFEDAPAAAATEGVAYVFSPSAADWSTSTSVKLYRNLANLRFGTSVAIAGDTIVVGAPWDSTDAVYAGAAYIYQYEGGLWVEGDRIRALELAGVDKFGEAVALSDNGNVVVVGSLWSNMAWLFINTGTDWGDGEVLTTADEAAQFGYGVDVLGETVLVGAPGADFSPEDQPGVVFQY